MTISELEEQLRQRDAQIKEQAARIKDIMENGLNDVLLVPSRVDQELGDNWGEVG